MSIPSAKTTPPTPRRRARGCLLSFLVATLALSAPALTIADELDFPPAYAVKGAKLFIGPGKVVDDGVLVIRRGLIEAVGPAAEVAPPFDAEVIDGKGLFVYPGFVDAFTGAGQRAGVERSTTGRGRLVDLSETTLATTPLDNRKGLTPEFLVSDALELNEGFAEPRRNLGFTALLSAPDGSIATGRSAVVSLTGLPRRDALLKSPVALHIEVAAPREPGGGNQPGPGAPGGGRGRGFGQRDGGTENPFPRVLMGSVSHLRQAMSDAERHQKLLVYAKDHPGVAVHDDPTLEVLAEARAKTLPVWWRADTRDEIHRALDLAREFGTTAVIVGGREAYKVVERLKAEKTSVVLRLDFPEEPKVPSEDEYRRRNDLQRDDPLRIHCDHAALWKARVGTAAVLAKAGVPFSISTDGVDKLENVPARLRAILAQGLAPEQALVALTQGPASLIGLESRLGSLEVGKLAHVVAFSGPFQDEKSKVRYSFIDGRKFERDPKNLAPRTPDREGVAAVVPDPRESRKGPSQRRRRRARPSPTRRSRRSPSRRRGRTRSPRSPRKRRRSRDRSSTWRPNWTPIGSP